MKWNKSFMKMYILKNAVKTLTGRWFSRFMLSSFLNWGQSSAHFIMSGKLREEIEIVNKRVIGEYSSELATRKIFPGILSKPVVFLSYVNIPQLALHVHFIDFWKLKCFNIMPILPNLWNTWMSPMFHYCVLCWFLVITKSNPIGQVQSHWPHC